MSHLLYSNTRYLLGALANLMRTPNSKDAPPNGSHTHHKRHRRSSQHRFSAPNSPHIIHSARVATLPTNSHHNNTSGGSLTHRRPQHKNGDTFENLLDLSSKKDNAEYHFMPAQFTNEIIQSPFANNTGDDFAKKTYSPILDVAVQNWDDESISHSESDEEKTAKCALNITKSVAKSVLGLLKRRHRLNANNTTTTTTKNQQSTPLIGSPRGIRSSDAGNFRRVRSVDDIQKAAREMDESIRVLVLGSAADVRAKHIAAMKGFPSIHFHLTPTMFKRAGADDDSDDEATDRFLPSSASASSLGVFLQPNFNQVHSNSNLILPSGVYWTDDLTLLPEIPSDTFDALLLFNITSMVPLQSSAVALMDSLHRILRTGGAIAGTGLFRNFYSESSSPYPFGVDDEVDDWSFLKTPSSSTTTNNSEDSDSPAVVEQEALEEIPFTLTPSLWSLRSFRDASESSGFFVHQTVDLTHEGEVTLQLNRAFAPGIDAEKFSRIEKHFAELCSTGRLICSRFMACKQTSSYERNNNVNIRCLSREEVQGWRNKVNSALQTSPVPSTVKTAPMSPLSLSLTQASSIPATALSPTPVPQVQLPPTILVSGIAIGLPNACTSRTLFDSQNFRRILSGENFISQLTGKDKDKIRDMNVVQLIKKAEGRVKVRLQKDEEIISVAGKIGAFDLVKEYGVPAHVVEAMDVTYQFAVAAGLEACIDAGIEVMERDEKGQVKAVKGLPEGMRDDTGVIFASSFPCIDSITQEVTKYAASKARKEMLQESASSSAASNSASAGEYEYDRKLLFKLLVMANCQLAELIKARGPNTQINAACAGTTQAVSIAQDWIRCGRAKRVIVISADTASSDLLLPFLGTGFMALGAASLAPQVSGAAIPFDKRRNGMIMGAGAVGIILEGQANSSSTSVLSRCPSPLSAGGSSVEVVDSHVANSAFHACLMDKTHIPQQLELFLQRLENVHGISRSTLASQLIYMAHETGTHSGGGCAKVELDAVAKCFGENYSQVLIANTKGFTGHPMGVAFEDAIAVYALRHNEITPLPNYSQCDEALPKGTNLSLKGGKHDRSYVLRFAAGFGSQMVYVLYRKVH